MITSNVLFLVVWVFLSVLFKVMIPITTEFAVALSSATVCMLEPITKSWVLSRKDSEKGKLVKGKSRQEDRKLLSFCLLSFYYFFFFRFFFFVLQKLCLTVDTNSPKNNLSCSTITKFCECSSRFHKSLVLFYFSHNKTESYG